MPDKLLTSPLASRDSPRQRSFQRGHPDQQDVLLFVTGSFRLWLGGHGLHSSHVVIQGL